jgi:hypothetical protein
MLPIQHPPIIHTRNAARLVRQQRLNYRPLKIRQIKTSHLNLHDPKVESSSCRFGNPLYEIMPYSKNRQSRRQTESQTGLVFEQGQALAFVASLHQMLPLTSSSSA